MNQTHDKCKCFGFKKCPHIKDDVMKRANQETQRFNGRDIPNANFPTDEEINKLCEKCQTFTHK